MVSVSTGLVEDGNVVQKGGDGDANPACKLAKEGVDFRLVVPEVIRRHHGQPRAANFDCMLRQFDSSFEGGMRDARNHRLRRSLEGKLQDFDAFGYVEMHHLTGRAQYDNTVYRGSGEEVDHL
jgi:hypothetical protein